VLARWAPKRVADLGGDGRPELRLRRALCDEGCDPAQRGLLLGEELERARAGARLASTPHATVRTTGHAAFSLRLEGRLSPLALRPVALTRSQVNERFYDAVGGEIVFETEAQGYLHPYAVAKLVAAQARERGLRELKLLELGANNCAFAMSLLKLLTDADDPRRGRARADRLLRGRARAAGRSRHSCRARRAAAFQRVVPGAAGRPARGDADARSACRRSTSTSCTRRRARS
jgi:hypothetical protein